MAGRGTDKLAALLGQHSRNRFAVFAPKRLARQNDGAGINFVGVQTRLLVGLVNDGTQCFGVHQTVAQIRRQRNGRLIKRGALYHRVAARQVFCNAP